MGFLGDPIFLGFGIGFLLGFLGNINRLGTIEGWGSIALVSMGTAAVMAIFPRVASIFAQAFTHLAAASRKFAKSQGREEIYIGVDDASGYGEPATLISGIILIPIILVVAAILPGNKILPLIDLVSIPFAIQAFVSFSNGNIFKVVVSAATWFAGGLLVATAVSPLFSQVYTSVMSDAVTNGSMVASLVIMTKPIWGNFTLLAINYGWVAVGILFVLYWPVTIIFKKNKVTIQNWLEHQAALDMIEEENVGADFDADDEGEAQPITEVAK
jgi:PTS system galactitol-specific IIC component